MQLKPSWSIAFWTLVFVFIAGAIQYSIPYPLDADTAYHAAVGQLIRQYGILHSFPWTPFSWLADHYADKELLFHLLFVPLVRFMSWTNAAQVIGTMGGTTILLTIYLILRTEKVRFPWLWAFIPLAASFEFIYRFVLVRPFLFSISLALVVLWSAARSRLIILAVASALYPWTYVAWHLPIILVCIVETARFLSTERIRFKPLLISLSGIITGLLLHPNMMNLVRMTWLEITKVLFRNAWNNKTGIDLGLELSATPFSVWTHSFMICVFMAMFALVFTWRNRKQDSTAFAFALTAFAFGLLTIKTYKFCEYFVPFSVLAIALATRLKSWRFLPLTILGVSLVYTFSLNFGSIMGLSKRSNYVPPTTLSFMQQTIPQGSLVFSPDWDLTGTLMLALPERRFVVALNTSYFYEKDPELYRLWYKIIHTPTGDSAMLIRQRFSSRYVICTNISEWLPLMRELSETPGVQTHIVDSLWVLFDLGELNQLTTFPARLQPL